MAKQAKKDIQFNFFSTPKPPVKPYVHVSARTISLNQTASIFSDTDAIYLANGSDQDKNVILIAAGKEDGVEATSFKYKIGKNGDGSVFCKQFIENIIVGELDFKIAPRKRYKFEAVVDTDAKTVMFKIK